MPWVERLTDPALLSFYLHALVGGSAVVLMCAVLSPLVVVKRLGFVGQGVSHAAFGGVGIAAVLAAAGLFAPGGWQEWGVIAVFCLAAALGMASVSDKRSVPVDTAIGLVLVGAMALGAVLVQSSEQLAVAWGNRPPPARWEAVLFGSILAVGQSEAVAAWSAGVGVVAALWWCRRPMLFWALDDESASAFGVPTGKMRVLLLVLLAVAVVTAMKLAGVILATALLVIPGATALRLTDRFDRCVLLSCVCSLVSLVLGLVLSIVMGWQAGPSIVLMMLAIFAAVTATAKLGAYRRQASGVGRP